jgi:threonine/homoserine/homoserine lactone efflux protein
MIASPRPPHEADLFAAGQAPPAPADWSLGHVGFGDVLDALNPLQYLPGVGMIYRLITGQHPHPALQIAAAGATSLLLGGPFGLAATMLVAAGSEILHAAQDAPADAAHAARLYARATQFG